MGLIVESRNNSIDIGYNGLYRLRLKIATLINIELGEHYNKLNEGLFLINEERNQFFKDYDEKIALLQEKYKISDKIIRFLYASDCDSKFGYGVCKEIYEIIKDYDDDVAYGYCGRSNCATFKDFKKIIKDCVDNKCNLKWS